MRGDKKMIITLKSADFSKNSINDLLDTIINGKAPILENDVLILNGGNAR